MRWWQRLTRRQFLTSGGLSLASVALPATLGTPRAGAAPPAQAPAPAPAMPPPPQPGIVTPVPNAVVLAGLTVLVSTRERLAHLLQELDREIHLLAAGEAGAAALPLLPRRRATNSGELGYQPTPEAALEVTLGFGASLFGGPDIGPDRFGLAAVRPRGLTPMPSFPGDDLDPAQTDSDLFLQLGASHPMVALHGLRHLLRRLGWGLALKYAFTGFTFFPGSGTPAPRGLLGYHDDTNNLPATDPAAMAEHVWIQPADEEPAWCLGGTYLVVRRIRELLERWDRESAERQDFHMGRRKFDGTSLLAPDAPPTAPFDYAADPDGRVVPLTAHVRRANPRRPGDEASRFLRRSFAYFVGDAGGTLDAGLLFMAFQRNIERQFAATKRRLEAPDDPALGSGPQTLSEYLVPNGGGYYFVPPAPASPDEFLGEGLLRAAG